MTLSIAFVDRFPDHEDGPQALGTIRLGGHSESFVALLDLRDEARYELQWRDAAERLTHGEDRAGFVTSVSAPGGFGDWWPARLRGAEVVLENHLHASGAPHREWDAFDPDAPRASVEPQDVSQWRVSIDSMRVWLESLA